MKKLYLMFMLFATSSYAADFSPTPMTLSIQSKLEYKFDGSPLEIPFTLTGKSGAVWLVVNTHGQAENIVGVRNGHLGWHYVNKIDTTIYISDRYERQPGENIITWDGKDENGNKAEPGSYDYYLWGYDDRSSRELVCNFYPPACNRYTDSIKLYEKDENGMPLSKPILYGNQLVTPKNYSKADLHRRAGTHFKWFIGNNPQDLSLLQTTLCSIYYPLKYPLIPYGENGGFTGNPEWLSYGGTFLDPNNYNIFYHTSFKNFPFEDIFGMKYDTYYSLFKWEFVPSGEAVLDQNWFDWEKGAWKTYSNYSYPSCYTDNNFIYLTNPSFGSTQRDQNTLQCMDFEGNLIFDKKIHDWYLPNEEILTANTNCSIDRIYTRTSDTFFLLGTYCCMHQLINTSRLIEDYENEVDMVVFTNSNGDYFMDNGWASDTGHEWFCIRTPMYPYKDAIFRYSAEIDNNDFNIIFIGNYGISSFGVSTQDGTGFGYMSFADDITPSVEITNAGGLICDNGSIYDGIYVGKSPKENDFFGDATSYSTYYVAFDSAHGLITNNPAVQEQNPLQFKVSQNTPNPFNSSTTISFSIPEKSNVTIDIYNITGQKIKTLINGPMSAGEHSVKWDAGGCSAGVYLYKIKAGKFEKIMRMTLVR